MPAASLRIDDDALSSEILRDVEASFAVTLPPEKLSHVATVGQLHDAIVAEAGYPGGEGSGSSLALDALRRALEPFGAPPAAPAGLLLGDLGLPRLRAARRALSEATGLTLPGLPLGWLGYAGVVLATLGPFVTWKLGFGWVSAVNILLGLVLVRVDPGSWSGEWKTLGGLARATAALNHYVLATRSAQHSPAASWRALTTMLADRTSVPAAEIGRDTRLSV